MKLTEARLRQIIREELDQARPLTQTSVENAYDQTVFDGLRGVDRVRAVAKALNRNFAADVPVSGFRMLTIVGPNGDIMRLGTYDKYDYVPPSAEEIKTALEQNEVDYVIRVRVSRDIVVPRDRYINRYVKGLPE